MTPEFEILTYDDPVLREKAQPVGEITDEHRAKLDAMAETMYSGRGIGLAATQVGLLERMIVVDVEWSEKRNGRNAQPPSPIQMINPEIIEIDDQDQVMSEGCLSLPGIEGDVWRPTWIKLRWQDPSGESVEAEAKGLLARCIQHEIDHLDGILFIDRMEPAQRPRIAGKLAKLRRLRAAKA